KSEEKLSKIQKEIDTKRGEVKSLEYKWRKEKLDTILPELKSLVGKCFKCETKNDRGEDYSYYKVLKAEPNYSVDNNHSLICLYFRVCPSYYGGNVYEIDNSTRMYQHIIAENEIHPSVFNDAYADMLEE